MRTAFGVRGLLFVVVVCGLLTGCETPSFYQKQPPTVVFLSDFGTKDDSVALCKGVMYTITPGLRVVDLTHDVPPYDIRTAGRLVAGAAPYYPKGTVFVAVVDPGVGSARKAIAALSKQGKFFVGPDNGLFTRVLQDEGLQEAREITNTEYWRKGATSHTFHGRDIFTPAAAYLADNAPFEEIGPVVATLEPGPGSEKPRLESGKLVGAVDFIEAPYGNVITDIPAALVETAGLTPAATTQVSVVIGEARPYSMPFAHTFSDVKPGELVALISSRGMLSFSINQGDFAKEFGAKAGQRVTVGLAR